MPDLLQLQLLLPDFALIALGYLICHHTPLDRPLWETIERLVYHLLFPALLFSAIVRQPIQLHTLAQIGSAGLAICVLGIVLAWALGRLPGVDAHLHASGAQTAYRFNSYVALALAERIAGQQGLAWLALVISVCVPVVNVAAVIPLARQGRQSGAALWRELARNPLIVSTLAGLVANLLGLKLPELASLTLARLGTAALPLGLMAVGAGLRLGALREGPGLAVGLMFIRHAVLPGAAIALVLALRLPPLQQAVIVAFAALPSASSAYVLAARMGGNGGYVAGLITVSTVLAMAGLPAALALLERLR